MEVLIGVGRERGGHGAIILLSPAVTSASVIIAVGLLGVGLASRQLRKRHSGVLFGVLIAQQY